MQETGGGKLSWRDAVISVLTDATEPMHYNAIAEEIARRGLRGDALGATPSSTVAAMFTGSFQDEGPDSPFIRVERGVYALRTRIESDLARQEPLPNPTTEPEAASETTGLVNAFGMFWDRSKVIWSGTPKVLGQQQTGSSPVDFCEQRGVYLLHDAQGVVYVGRATGQGIGWRLGQHINDRLGGRWTRFSWFGVYQVKEDGSLNVRTNLPNLPIDIVIVTMEAVLIEGLEPRQNRKRGDDFKAVEYLQLEDPAIERERTRAYLRKASEALLP